jgi:hypothetical protein
MSGLRKTRKTPSFPWSRWGHDRKFMPRQTRARDGVDEREGRPGFWISYVDEYGKRRQQYGGPTVTQTREKREEIRTRVREVKEALANGEPLPTEDTFGVVAKRYVE